MSRYCLAALHEIDDAVSRARRVLVASDFDGTLCPLARTPEEVRLPPAAAEMAREIALCDRLHLAVISGRSLADVARRLPSGLTIAGNHGLEIEGRGFRFEHAEASRLRPLLQQACETLRLVMDSWPGAWVENKGLSATLHYRAVDERSHNRLLFAARGAVTSFSNSFALRAGKKALEIRPRVSWEKGDAVRYIREQSGPFDAVVCLGDDRTDETMFADEAHIGIKIGGCGEATRASYYLSDPTEVAVFLSHLLDVCQARPPAEPLAMRAS